MIQEAHAVVQATQATADAIHSNGDVITGQLAGAMFLAYLLQWVKHSRLIPWISDHTKGINYALTGLMSLVASVGIHYSFDSTAGALTITGLQAGSLLSGVWHWATQWAFQQGASDMIFTKSIATDVQIGDVGKPTGVPTAVAVAARAGDGN